MISRDTPTQCRILSLFAVKIFPPSRCSASDNDRYLSLRHISFPFVFFPARATFKRVNSTFLFSVFSFFLLLFFFIFFLSFRKLFSFFQILVCSSFPDKITRHRTISTNLFFFFIFYFLFFFFFWFCLKLKSIRIANQSIFNGIEITFAVFRSTMDMTNYFPFIFSFFFLFFFFLLVRTTGGYGT